MIRLPSEKPRILVVALDNVGDLVFASALVPPLLARWPEAEIDVWSKAYSREIARLIPGTRAVVAADPFWSRSPGQTSAPIGPFLASIGRVRRSGYDVAILSGAPWRTAAAVALARVPVRIGCARHRNGVFLTHQLPAERGDRPVLVEQARLLEPLGVESRDPRYVLDPSRLGVYRDRVRQQLPARVVALHPFAGDAARCVSIDTWRSVADTLIADGMSPLWLGTRAELVSLRATMGDTERSFFVDEMDDGSFSAAAAAVSLASLLVGHDSGPLHVAGAFGVPVVGVFAPGEPRRTFPQGIGPWRMLEAPSPSAVQAAMILREIEALRVTSGA